MAGRAGLEGVGAVLLLQDILVLCGDAGGEPDVDVPLRVCGGVVTWVQGQDDAGGVVEAVAEFRRVAREEHVLPERRCRVDAEDDFAEACDGRDVGRTCSQRWCVCACAVV